MGRSNQPREKGGGVYGVIPGEREGIVRESKGEVNPIKSSKVDLLWGKRVRRPVGVVGHYERASVGERGRRLGLEGSIRHMENRGGIREKPKEEQDRHRNNKRLHIKKEIGTSPGGGEERESN